MRITKQYLRKIIKEEREKLFSESMHMKKKVGLKARFEEMLAQTGGYYNERIADMAIDLLNSGELSSREQAQIGDELDEFYTDDDGYDDLYEGIRYANEDVEDQFFPLDSQFNDVAESYGWIMESIDGVMEDDVGSGNFDLLLIKPLPGGDYALQCKYSYSYQPYGADEDVWDVILTGPEELDISFRYGTDGGMFEDIDRILKAFDKSYGFNEALFRKEIAAR
jgi:hypothetical protein